MQYYFAYGSNLHHEQMKRRCPKCRYIKKYTLNNITKVVAIETNNKKALENIVFYIKNSFVIVVEYENIIVGTLAATVDETWYSDKKFMRTLWLHVSPQHRRFSIFRSLMIVFKEYALANKVTAICEIFQGKDVERKNNAFIKLGFKVIGGTFIVNG